MGIFDFFKKKKTEQTETSITNGQTEQSDFFENDLSQEDSILVTEDEDEIIVPEEIVTSEIQQEIEYEDLEDYDPRMDLHDYRLPLVELLNVYESNEQDSGEIEEIKAKIISILQINNIDIVSIMANIGYVNTLYEIVPKAGFRISQIKQLKDDLAFGLLVPNISVEPMMDKGVIGIIIPNRNFKILPIQTLIASRNFIESDFELPLILGRTMHTKNFIVDLTKLPHILIAGATGQGKSVLMNIMIASLLYKKHPAELKFILIDPHILEFNLYSRIEKHFLAKLPDVERAVISDVYKAEQSLKALCREMDSRYELLLKSDTKNIRDYNNKFKKRLLNPLSGHRFLPYIVVIIDEYFDLKISTGEIIESTLIRLTRKAHNVGIHIILSTQRPTKDVITGNLKANFPVKIAFKVASSLESRIILDRNGAEELTGCGDILYSEGMNTSRLQIPFISTEEVEGISSFIGNQQGYLMAYELPEDIDSLNNYSIGNIDLNDRDPLFDEAARLIVIHQQGSTSLVQRKFSIGYSRAGRLMDQLEAAGIVGPTRGAQARDVLITDEYSLEQKLNMLM